MKRRQRGGFLRQNNPWYYCKHGLYSLGINSQRRQDMRRGFYRNSHGQIVSMGLRRKQERGGFIGGILMNAMAKPASKVFSKFHQKNERYRFRKRHGRRMNAREHAKHDTKWRKVNRKLKSYNWGKLRR